MTNKHDDDGVTAMYKITGIVITVVVVVGLLELCQKTY